MKKQVSQLALLNVVSNSNKIAFALNPINRAKSLHSVSFLQLDAEEQMENQSQMMVESSMMELGRFFNSKDEPIVLSQTHNHARLVLSNKSMAKPKSGPKENYPADD
jgi:hypothetical protein